VPGDKSVSHRVALFALLAPAVCRGAGWLESEDTWRSAEAARALGATVRLEGGALSVAPPPAPPADGRIAVDCGNSGTTARLLMGLLAGWLPPGGAEVVLSGDASLSSRPMARVVDPLRAMGADIRYLETEGRLPLAVRGAPLRGLTHAMPVASAQVKSALLLAGMFAAGETVVTGGAGSRDHTELMLATMGADCRVDDGGDRVTLTPGRALDPYDVRVPGDPSTAAFLQVAAALVPGSDVTVAAQSLNPTRAGFLNVLRRAGVPVQVERPFGRDEIAGDVRVAAAAPRAFTVEPAEVPTLVDEIPVLAVLATQADGVSEFRGAGELRVKESDRLAVMTENLRALGARVDELPDGLRVHGPCALRGGAKGTPTLLRTAGDHRIAMSLAVAALVAEGDSALDDDACVAVSFPGFFAALDGLRDGRD
jgi:3-phosphoshikimate 1-carboxyvinyltransferase